MYKRRLVVCQILSRFKDFIYKIGEDDVNYYYRNSLLTITWQEVNESLVN